MRPSTTQFKPRRGRKPEGYWMRPVEDTAGWLMRFLYQQAREGQTGFLTNDRFDGDIGDAQIVFLRGVGKLVPDFPGDKRAEERERNQKRRPPVPVERSQVAEAERLD